MFSLQQAGQPIPTSQSRHLIKTIGHPNYDPATLSDWLQVAGTGVINPAVQALTDKMTPAIRRNAAAMLLQVRVGCGAREPWLGIRACGVELCAKPT